MRQSPAPSPPEPDIETVVRDSLASEDGLKSPWWVYLVQCADGTFYTGITTNPQRRLRQHNGELVGGARYTRPRRPVILVYTEACCDRSQAGQREAAIRRLSRSRKLALTAP
ncbi:GIY-YIG nuclease family protein [Saccharospirillum sp.]|uniref:GIY-YIG nuclease family protein n=1 Tax=Saccharospirillum sp. TaxID=2033801 RepID=UPI00349FE4BC